MNMMLGVITCMNLRLKRLGVGTLRQVRLTHKSPNLMIPHRIVLTNRLSCVSTEERAEDNLFVYMGKPWKLKKGINRRTCWS
jgi:hypothetical protein